MGIIYLLRHGETEGNSKGIFRGKLNLPLNDKGLGQAEALVSKLKYKKINKIYSSPLTRAIQTVTPLSKELSINIEVDPSFDDIDVGKWQGMEIEEVKKSFPGLFSIWKNSPDIFKFPHGGSLDMLRETSFSRLLELAKNNDDPICIVTHQVVNRVLLLTALGQDLKKYWNVNQNTACINVLEYKNNSFIIHCINSGYLEG